MSITKQVVVLVLIFGLWLQETASQTGGEVSIRKCCPAGQVLNQWHSCEDSKKAEAAQQILVNTLCPNTEGCHFQHVGFTCPQRVRVEHHVKGVAKNDSSLYQLTTSTVVSPIGGCVEMTSDFEGPLFVTCDSTDHDASSGFLTKCCPNGYALNNEVDGCVKIPGNLRPEDGLPPLAKHKLLPPRMVRDPRTGKANAPFHLNILSKDLQKACGQGRTARYQSPRHVYTNDSGLFEAENGGRGGLENLALHDFDCIDRVMVNRQPNGPASLLAEPYALVCEDVPQVEPVTSTRPKCGDTQDYDLCVPKCCPANELFNSTVRRCFPASNPSLLYKPSISESSRSPRTVSGLKLAVKNFQLAFMHAEGCSDSYRFIDPDSEVSLLPNGDLVAVNKNKGVSKFYSGPGFCIDHFDGGDGVPFVLGFVCNELVPRVVDISRGNASVLNGGLEFEAGGGQTGNGTSDLHGTCGDKDLISFNKRLRTAYTLCGLFSLVFLVITMFVYMTLPSLKNLHGKIVLSNVTSILLTTVLLVLIYNVHKHEMATDELVIVVPASICHGLGYSLYYAGISMFCWMSVMCIDLCWTFARATIPRKGSDRTKFLCYSLFGWGMPAIMAGLTAMFDVNEDWGYVRPQMGHTTCFLSMRGARFFFYMPILILLCFNTLMYLVTVYSLWSTRRASKKAGLHRISTNSTSAKRSRSFVAASPGGMSREPSLRSNSNHLVKFGASTRGLLATSASVDNGGGQVNGKICVAPSSVTQSNSDTREQLVLFTKLFLIMGLSWLSECIHVELHGDHTNMTYCNFYVEVVLRLIGGLNMIRGFFIFLVFICKPKIWGLVRTRHPKLWNSLSCGGRLCACGCLCCFCCDLETASNTDENSRASLRIDKVDMPTPRTQASFELTERSPQLSEETVPLRNGNLSNHVCHGCCSNPTSMTTNGKLSRHHSSILTVRTTYLEEDRILDLQEN